MQKIKISYAYNKGLTKDYPYLATAEPEDNPNDIGCLGQGRTWVAAEQVAIERLRQTMMVIPADKIVEVDW